MTDAATATSSPIAVDTPERVERPRAVERIVVGTPTSDGAGVRLTRVLTQNLQRRLDPFLMLDAFGSDDPGDYIGGFPDHPHRGFETVTYMIAGRMRHRDSAGHEGLLANGGVQWMTAGRGLIHSELPEQEEGADGGLPALAQPAGQGQDVRRPGTATSRAGRSPNSRRRRRAPCASSPAPAHGVAGRGAARATPSRSTSTCTSTPARASRSRCRPGTTPSSTSTAAR